MSERGIPLREPTYVVETVTCLGCERLAEADKQLGGKPGRRARLRPSTTTDFDATERSGPVVHPVTDD